MRNRVSVPKESLDSRFVPFKMWRGKKCACVHFEKLRNHCASQIDSIGDKTRQKRLECFAFFFS